MPYIKKGKTVLIKRIDCPCYNKIGKIIERNGEYYYVLCNNITLELYHCEIEEIKHGN